MKKTKLALKVNGKSYNAKTNFRARQPSRLPNRLRRALTRLSSGLQMLSTKKAANP